MSDLATRLCSAIEDYGDDCIDDVDASYGRYPGSGASSRMRHEIVPRLAKVAELETALRELVRAVPSCHYCGDPATSEHADLYDVHVCYACDECTMRHAAIAVIELDHASALRKAQTTLETK